MESTHKETPLPWICSHQGNDTDFCIHAPKEADGCYPIVAIVMHQLGEIQRVGNIKNAYSKNGEFIVRACNAHDELVKSAKAISALLSRWRAYGLVGEVEANPIGKLILDHDQLHDLLRAAISKAEGDDQPNGGADV